MNRWTRTHAPRSFLTSWSTRACVPLLTRLCHPQAPSFGSQHLPSPWVPSPPLHALLSGQCPLHCPSPSHGPSVGANPKASAGLLCLGRWVKGLFGSGSGTPWVLGACPPLVSVLQPMKDRTVSCPHLWPRRRPCWLLCLCCADPGNMGLLSSPPALSFEVIPPLKRPSPPDHVSHPCLPLL